MLDGYGTMIRMPHFQPHPAPLRFGIFMPPMHKTGVNPTLALHRDLELIEHLDRLGYAEAWIGEHHSAGIELIASPEVFIAAAAERTKHIKLGTGVNSLPYHHPFILADRIVMLDHLTRGRMMFGAGPGQLTSDAAMLGIDPDAAAPADGAGLRRDDAAVRRRDRHREDRLVHVRRGGAADAPVQQLRHRCGVVACRRRVRSWPAATAPACCRSRPPSPPRSGCSTTTTRSGRTRPPATVTRRRVRSGDLMGPMHIAETVEQAKENCRYGLQWVFDYLSHIIPMGDPNDPPAAHRLRRLHRLRQRDAAGW